VTRPVHHIPRACKGGVISDLHLLSTRSTFHHHEAAVEKAIGDSSLFVFGGDIFDFEWSRHSSEAESVGVAHDWVRELCERHPTCRMVFLQGNHDCSPAYSAALNDLQETLDNLEWYPLHWRLDDKLFLHGDVYHGHTEHELLAYRRLKHMRMRRHPILHALYYSVLKMGLSRMFLASVSRERAAAATLGYMHDVMPAEERDQIKEVYFGHVHTPFTHFEQDGVKFHNMGAAVIGTSLRVARFPYQGEGCPGATGGDDTSSPAA
jgi:UDP-2,3-diacylglucosamine pyrophosphatase LpxH